MNNPRTVSRIPRRSNSLSRSNSSDEENLACRASLRTRPRTGQRVKPRAQSVHENIGSCFIKQEKEHGLPVSVLKQARLTGHLNLSNKGMIEVPDIVWNLNSMTGEEGKHMSLSFDTSMERERWWDYVDLTKLIIASNKISFLPNDISNLTSLTVLDLHDNQISALPDALGELRSLNKLDICHNRLVELPDCIFKLLDLRILIAHHNCLTELNDDIGNLSRLEELNLSNNEISELPNTIGFLSRCSALNLAHNNIEYLPNDISSMTALRILDITKNRLLELPEDLGSCLHLEQLYLRHNQLNSIPDRTDFQCLKELHMGNNQLMCVTPRLCECLIHLKVLDLRDNKISELPEEISLIHGLERFDLTNNRLINLPVTIATLVHLKSLCLEGNPLRSIRRDIVQRGTVQLLRWLKSRMEDSPYDGMQNGNPPSEEELLQAFDKYTLRNSRALDISNRNLKELPKQLVLNSLEADVGVVDLSKNGFTDFPECLEPLLPKLSELKMGFNRLTVLPSLFGMCTRLVFLDFRNNQLTELPIELSAAQNLREINISCNKFKEFPSVIFTMENLEIIFASDNNIECIDIEKLSNLTRLAALDITNNNIMKVPPEIGNMKQLRTLQLEGNPFRNPRPAVLAKGTQYILEYLRDRIPR